MNENMINRSYEVQAEGDSLRHYTTKAFGWISAGLLATFIATVGFTMVETVFYTYSFRYWPLVLLATGLGIVICLSARTEKMSVGTTRSLFFLYTALNGVVFNTYLSTSNPEILWTVSGITALFSGIMTSIDWFDSINFAKLRPFMLGGLVFPFFYWIFVVSIDLSVFDIIVPTVGIFLLLVLTVCSVKKIWALHAYCGQAPEVAAEVSIFSVLQPYLDFINLFVHITRVLGRRK